MFVTFQLPPPVPGYMCARGVGRVYDIDGSCCQSTKRVVSAWRAGWRDGRYHGWRGLLVSPTLPVPVIWDDVKLVRQYRSHLYSIGFYLGQIQDVPAGTLPPNVTPDSPEIHDRIALVSECLFMGISQSLGSA